ncbi:Salt tolerance protein [Acorus calamus]|uniref:Salt tolerance protein n=1 Tax=Acorus calamus TaxID=4465 RepID=A0AAV9F1Q7_ACOCL|nr:Salt tolerance protein [Acorus calamus]
MKIQCDVCEEAPATVICCADEAALCVKCDVEIHAANKLASKHQRLHLNCLSNKLPKCDICQERAAFIFCVEDRALFCKECDEPIHVAGTLSGEHQRFLATGICVALSSSGCGKEVGKSSLEPPNPNPSPPPSFQKPPPPQPSSNAFASSAVWAVDEFLQLSDCESADKKESIGFGELEWFADIGFFDGAQQEVDTLAAAEVPQLPLSPPSLASAATTAAYYKPIKSNTAFKKPRITFPDDDEYFTVPDLG